MMDGDRGTARGHVGAEFERGEGWRINYAFSLLDYMRFFNNSAETRANYLIVTNSIFLLGLFSLLEGNLLEGLRNPILLGGFALSTCCLFLSVGLAVITFFPRTLDGGTPLNHNVVGAMARLDYLARVGKHEIVDGVEDVLTEVHVLCRVANVRFMWVRRSAIAFFCGVIVSFLTLIGSTISLSLLSNPL